MAAFVHQETGFNKLLSNLHKTGEKAALAAGRAEEIMKTPAIKCLKSNRIPFEIKEYEHQHRGGAFCQESYGLPCGWRPYKSNIDF